jgi:hypothetical protein
MYAIAFLLPFILFYEIGTIFDQYRCFEPHASASCGIRVASGISCVHRDRQQAGWLISPLVVVVILLGLPSPRASRGGSCQRLPPMVLECILLAVPLIV